MRYMRLLLLFVIVCQCFVFSQTKWVSAYYAGWMQGYLPPSAIDFGAFTHIMFFSIEPSGAGALDGSGNGITTEASHALVTAAHAAGKKVLVTCGGFGTDQGFVSSTSSANVNTFVTNLVNFVMTNGFDGIDLDWEPVTSTAQFQVFVPKLRAALDAAKPGLLLTIAAVPDDIVIASVAGSFDQINLMTYDLSGSWPGWVTWHNSPIYDGGFRFPSTGELVPSANGAVDAFVAAGVPKAKLGIGTDFYGYVWTGVSQPRQAWTGNGPDVASNVAYSDLMQTYSAYPMLWDTAAGAAYISIPTGSGKFISLDNEKTMFAKADYVNSKSIGGMIIWELGGGYQASAPAGQRDRLLQAVKQAFMGGAPPPSDSIRPTVSLTAPANNAVLIGSVTVSATASDNIGVVGVQFTVDGTPFGNEITASPYSALLNTWRFANGSHTLGAVARDWAGNRGTSGITISINNQGSPPVTPDLVVFDDKLHAPFDDASWSATANYSNSSPVNSGTKSVRVNYLSWGGFDIMSGNWNAEVDIDPLTYDTLRFSVYPTTQYDIAIGFYVDAERMISPPANVWTNYAIPVPSSPFSRFYFCSQAANSRVAYFDNIKFTGGLVLTGAPALDTQPREFKLEQNYPNPFNPRTTIGYTIPRAVHVTLKVYDALGKEVATLVDEQKAAGSYRVAFNGNSIASGTYFYRIQAGDHLAVRKLVLLK